MFKHARANAYRNLSPYSVESSCTKLIRGSTTTTQRNLTVRDFLKSSVAVIGLGGVPFAIRGSAPPDRQMVHLDVPGGVIDISFDPESFDLSAADIVNWVSNAARAVATYYGVFPVPRMRVRIESSENRPGVSHGTTWGYKPPLTRIFVGRHTSQAQLDEDWMMTHELVHTAFPDVADEHHWIEEGIATYVEPIARVQAGELTPETIWADMVRDMPKGQPREGDGGLDHTHTWGRTYWGGALFCLWADVQIHLASPNKVGLQTALRGIQRDGGTIDADWPLERAFSSGDRATKTNVLTTLYREMKDKPVTLDLQSLWRSLGVTIGEEGKASFDDQAPWAAIRLAITVPLNRKSVFTQKDFFQEP